MYKWIKSIIGTVFDSPIYTLPKIFTKCIEALQERNMYLEVIFKDVSNIRQTVIGRQFLRVLSTGDSEIEPLESFLISNPITFCSNTLAWIHQTLESEASSLATIFLLPTYSISKLNTSKINSKIKTRSKTIDPSLKRLMSTISEGFCRPLELRLSQAIHSLSKPTDLYQTANLIAFYYQTFSTLCETNSALCETLNKCRNIVADAFRYALSQDLLQNSEIITSSSFSKENNNKIDNNKGLSKGTLTQGQIKDAIKIAGEVAMMHKDQALSPGFEVSSLLEGYITMLKNTISLSKESFVFKTNTLYELSVVCDQASLKTTAVSLQEDVIKLIGKIVDEEVEHLIHRCRMSEVYRDFSEIEGNSIKKLPDKETVRNTIARFEKVIETAAGTNKALSPACGMIENPNLQKKAREMFANKILNIYRIIFDSVMNPINQYLNPTDIFKYTPEAMGKLLLS